MAEMESEQKKMGEENEERRSAPLTCEDAPVGEQNAQEKKCTRNTQLAIFFPPPSRQLTRKKIEKRGKTLVHSPTHTRAIYILYTTYLYLSERSKS
jgi:hypothetical protein